MNPRWIAFFAPVAAAAAALAGGCGTTSAPNPFDMDAGSDAAEDAPHEGGEPADGGPGVDPTLGGPCLDDGQCNDKIDCTFDKCDTKIGRCRFTPDDSKCQNGVFCDGVERCDNKLGCRAGPPVGCEDNTPCTIDQCDEATQSCKHTPRDLDGDGDPDIHCPGGHDCDDNDPTVNSLTPEVCGNMKDDNCDGMVDEMPCSSPTHDTCLDPLQVSLSGTYAMNTTGAKFDYPTTCAPGTNPGARDVVAAVVLPAGPPVDVEVAARTLGYPVYVAMAGQCGDPSTELACGAGLAAGTGGLVAKARARGIGSASGSTAYPIYVATTQGVPVALDVQIEAAVPKATNETCGTAAPLTPGVPITTEIIDAAPDLGSACATSLGELVYSFTLAAPSNVDVYASSLDDDGSPMISLRGAGCAMPSDEITCQAASPAHVVRHALPAGDYYVAVSATAPTKMQLTLDVSAPTTSPVDETCVGSPVIVPNKTFPVTLTDHQDDVSLGCLSGAVDAAYELDLAVPSDVLIVERIANGDIGAVGLAPPACMSSLVCQASGYSPVRAARHNVPAGQYRVVAESKLGEDVELTAFVRPAVPATLVPFSDGCADAFVIPDTGGFFQGNTGNATADFSAGCDQGGVQPMGAPDQLGVLTLSATKRVIFDMAGSGYNTLLDIRKGPGCPGTEVPNACTAGYSQQRSYLDLTLGAGTYYVQIDGFVLDKGPWFLDVRVVDP